MGLSVRCSGGVELRVTYVMRSLRSLVFLRPPKAILVPGMNFLGFSR